MKNEETPSAAVRSARRRMLGAMTLATAPAVLPAASQAARIPGLAGSTPAAAAASRSTGGPLLRREGWLLARSDR